MAKCARDNCQAQAKRGGLYCSDRCRQRQWRTDNPDKWRAQTKRHRERKQGNGWQARRAAIIERYCANP